MKCSVRQTTTAPSGPGWNLRSTVVGFWSRPYTSNTWVCFWLICDRNIKKDITFTCVYLPSLLFKDYTLLFCIDKTIKKKLEKKNQKQNKNKYKKQKTKQIKKKQQQQQKHTKKQNKTKQKTTKNKTKNQQNNKNKNKKQKKNVLRIAVFGCRPTTGNILA